MMRWLWPLLFSGCITVTPVCPARTEATCANARQGDLIATPAPGGATLFLGPSPYCRSDAGFCLGLCDGGLDYTLCGSIVNAPAHTNLNWP